MQDTATLLEMVLQKKPMRATIREESCIGCLKCINACPVDAIVGAAGFMHTVLHDQCIGCEHCVAPCPMDCIDMIASTPLSLQAICKAGDRIVAKTQRLAHQVHIESTHYEHVKNGFQTSNTKEEAINARKAVIEAILSKEKPFSTP